MSISLHLQCFSGDRTPVQHTLSAALPMALSLMHIKADRLDDLLRRVFSELLKSPNRIKPRRGHATELAGVLLHLTKRAKEPAFSLRSTKACPGIGEM